MIFPSLLLLTTTFCTTLEPIPDSLHCSHIQPSTHTSFNFQENLKPIFHSLVDSALYFGAGVFFGTTTLLGGIGWAICQLSPWAESTGNECLISSQIFGIASLHSFAQGLKTSPLFSFFFTQLPSSHSAWELNKRLLSGIPASSLEDKTLLDFLQRRWLAKTTGCYPFHIDWMCPSFGISFQVHPESTNSYARDPATKRSDTYKNRVEAWKHLLPHPKDFPLILTRPFNIRERLPLCFEISETETIQQSIDNLASAIHPTHSFVIIDLTPILSHHLLDRNRWLDVWKSCENALLKACNEQKLDLNRMLCIHRVQQKDLGGIRLLPFSFSSKENIEKQYQFLMEWISRFGLTANRVELDRLIDSKQDADAADGQMLNPDVYTTPVMEFASKEQWIRFLDSMDRDWKSNHPQKTLMFKGTLQVLKALGTTLSQEKWEEVMHSPTCLAIVQLCFKKIKHQLHALIQEEGISFHAAVSSIEQIHADFTSLLEVFAPFTAKDFPEIYKKHLTSIPLTLQPFTSYAIHSSGMTSIGAIFQAVEKQLGKQPARILYGKNTYFEIINLAERVSQALSIEEAKEEDWKEADLILAQFNPTVKRINFKVTEYQATEYHVEKIAEILHKALKIREGKPLSIAIDCTLDYSDPARMGQLLAEFQHEIERGDLNIICYRSGLKFDLFGMDNYCGAPFFMVNNHDAKWSFFDSLLTDPALQTDRLSLNWFCLVYQYAAPYLESYRKQIFDNTRAVLDKIPTRLYSKENSYYRVIPIDQDVDPSFIDIKIFGPLHAFRGELLVGVYLTIKCMEAGYPLLYRPGIGFHHPNLAVLYGQECTTVRLTVGLDPDQIDVIVRCMERIDACNGP